MGFRAWVEAGAAGGAWRLGRPSNCELTHSSKRRSVRFRTLSATLPNRGGSGRSDLASLNRSPRLRTMTDADPIRLLKHEAVPDTGIYEVRFADGRSSIYVYWDDLPSRRLRPDVLTREQAEAEAKTIARTERDKLTGHGA